MVMQKRILPFLLGQLVCLCLARDSIAFSIGSGSGRSHPQQQQLQHTPISVQPGDVNPNLSYKHSSHHVETTCRSKSTMAALTAAAIVMGSMATLSPVWADELGRETEAPTFGTGENVMICTKRGPLGACLKTELRTAENENDVSEKYFQQPTELVKRKDNAARTAEVTEGNALIERLKQQSEDNREKNDLLVKQRTMMNDSSASFGPFDGQVLILNEDGKGFTLLANPQAMRLKKAGFISDDRKFINQPTKEQIDNALEPEMSGGGFLDRILGGS